MKAKNSYTYLTKQHPPQHNGSEAQQHPERIEIHSGRVRGPRPVPDRQPQGCCEAVGRSPGSEVSRLPIPPGGPDRHLPQRASPECPPPQRVGPFRHCHDFQNGSFSSIKNLSTPVWICNPLELNGFSLFPTTEWRQPANGDEDRPTTG